MGPPCCCSCAASLCNFIIILSRIYRTMFQLPIIAFQGPQCLNPPFKFSTKKKVYKKREKGLTFGSCLTFWDIVIEQSRLVASPQLVLFPRSGFFGSQIVCFTSGLFIRKKMRISVVACIVLSAILMLNAQQSNGALSAETQMLIEEANMSGPYLGLVIPNSFEMDPLLQSPNFTSSNLFVDFSGRRFRFGTIANKQVILVMTGLSMINAAITTQLLLSVFNIEGVMHYGIAGNANPSFNLADVVIPQYWSHSALWSWQRYGEGPQDELPLEANGDYTREFGYLNVANYTVNVTDGSSYDSLLNNIWFQPEEVFPIDGTPEERQHAFWVAVDPLYYEISQKLEELELERCLNATTCLPHTPKVARVQRGTSASIFLSNAAYRSFLYDKFNITPLDMESASVALICLQQRVPFIAIRSLSSSLSGDPNEASKFVTLASKNSVTAVVEFIKQLSLHQLLINH